MDSHIGRVVSVGGFEWFDEFNEFSTLDESEIITTDDVWLSSLIRLFGLSFPGDSFLADDFVTALFSASARQALQIIVPS